MTGPISLWDWRRTITDLYADIRGHQDPRAAHRRWQAARSELFANHPQSPIDEDKRNGKIGPYLFEYDPSLRLFVGLEPMRDARSERIDTGADGIVELYPFARTSGLLPTLGKELTIYWITGYGGGAFLPFADATNGKETYGGGRYLLDTIKGADLGSTPDGRTILDFNFAYYPSCAYSARFVCPLAPASNRLSAPVRGGNDRRLRDLYAARLSDGHRGRHGDHHDRGGDQAPNSGDGGAIPNVLAWAMSGSAVRLKRGVTQAPHEPERWRHRSRR
jgi:uncharacterized protein (DUF1684 family)